VTSGQAQKEKTRSRERERERERDRARKRAEGGVRGKKKSMETSCSIGEVFPRLGHAQVCNLLGFFGKKPHARFGTLPRGDPFAYGIQGVPRQPRCPLIP